MIKTVNALTNFGWWIAAAILTAAVLIWLAAAPVVVLAAKILVSAGALAGLVGIGLAVVLAIRFFKLRIAENRRDLVNLARDEVLAQSEARQARVAADSAEFDLHAKAALFPTLKAQIEAGKAIPASLAGIGVRQFGSTRNIIERAENLLPAPVDVQWPEVVNLFDLIPDKQGNLNDIILGITIDEETGRQRKVSASIENLLHAALGGETGTGKSTEVYSLAYQIATAPQDVSMVLADPRGTTWKTFANLDRLMFPIITEERDLLYALTQLNGEAHRRTSELFAPYPTVEKLSDYNAKVGPDERLPYIVVFMDEFPDFMDCPDIQTLVKRSIRKTRKAGVFLFGVGTSWKNNDLDTSIRRQFLTRIHFAASDPHSSRTLLNDGVASTITAQGRAYAKMHFGIEQGLVQIQAPYIDKEQVLELLNPGTILDLPVSAADEVTMAEKAVIDSRLKNGKSWSECYRVYHRLTRDSKPPKKPSAAQITVVKNIIQKHEKHPDNGTE